MIEKLFNEPKIMCIVGDVNTGKSNFLYDVISDLRNNSRFNLITYGLRNKLPYAKEIYSVEELENVRNSVIVIDELFSLWDLDNRKVKRQIENSLRLIHHNNNILVLCCVPENIKKFISAKINTFFFKKCTLSDFVNGSSAKNVLVSYKGEEMGSSVLNIKSSDALIWNNGSFGKIKGIHYYREYDNKIKNVKIFHIRKKDEEKCSEIRSENCANSVPNNVLNSCEEKNVPINVPSCVANG
jgi:hypothetical protein